jgi:hypothetical protein
MTPPAAAPPAARRQPKLNRVRALETAAASRDGCTEAIMLAHSFTPKMMVEMIRDGLAAASSERMVAGGKSIEIARVRITDAGRRAL